MRVRLLKKEKVIKYKFSVKHFVRGPLASQDECFKWVEKFLAKHPNARISHLGPKRISGIKIDFNTRYVYFEEVVE